MLMMDGALAVMLFGLNCWGWFLACSGYTTIEFMKRVNRAFDGDTDEHFDFSFDTVRDNLFVVFGTTKIARIFSPSLRALPFNGIEWSFMMKD